MLVHGAWPRSAVMCRSAQKTRFTWQLLQASGIPADAHAIMEMIRSFDFDKDGEIGACMTRGRNGAGLPL